MAEKKVDPAYPGQEYTYAELSKAYAGEYSKKALKAYWEDECYVKKSKGKAKEKAKAKAKVKAKAEAKEPKERKPPKSGRFQDPWFRQYDRATSGFVDACGFTSRLPLRLESTETMIHGFVDAKKMWDDFPDEDFHPVLCGDKAVVSIWFNNFIDTDCGGEYLETWYNTFVTPKNTPQVTVDAEAGPMGVITNPTSLIFLQRVVCGDTARNPGAAMKAIVGGRGVFGFPKHPEVGEIDLKYEEADGKKVKISFDGKHLGKKIVSMSLRLPEADEGAITIPLEAKTGPDTVISCPKNYKWQGANQVRFGQAFKCTQHLKPWDEKTDTLTFGDDPFYAEPIKKWGFTPIMKVHSPDFKIAAFKPVSWCSGRAAAKAVREFEGQSDWHPGAKKDDDKKD